LIDYKSYKSNAKKKFRKLDPKAMEKQHTEKAGGQSQASKENDIITWTERVVRVTDIGQFRTHTSKGPHTGKANKGMLYYVRRHATLMLPQTIQPDTDTELLKRQIALGQIYTHAQMLDYEKWKEVFGWK